MYAQVKQWGNSRGIRLSRAVLQEAGFGENEELDVKVTGGKIVLSKWFHHKTLEERAKEFDGNLRLDGEFDWGKPQGREMW